MSAPATSTIHEDEGVGDDVVMVVEVVVGV